MKLYLAEDATKCWEKWVQIKLLATIKHSRQGSF